MNQRSARELDDPYAELPDLYDLEHAGFTDDVDLYLRLAEVVGDPILELGCGTGRVLGPLAAPAIELPGSTAPHRCWTGRAQCCKCNRSPVLTRSV